MVPASVAVLAVLVASEPGPSGGLLVAQFARPSLEEELLLALPSPPETVVRVTKRYGTVTIDHQRHLEAHATCKGCHGPGVVSKITFTPQIAHERCLGCHKQRSQGPTHCAGCHLRTLPSKPAAEMAQAMEAKAPDAAGSARAAPGGRPVAAPVAGPVPVRAAPPSRETIELGLAAGRGFGPSLQVASRRGAFVAAYSFERLDAAHDARMFGLVGFGLRRSVGGRVALVALGLGGFDMEERPLLGLLPAVGVRVGAEWTSPRTWFLRTVRLSASGVADVPLEHAFGHHGGGGRIFVTIAAGIPLPSDERRIPSWRR